MFQPEPLPINVYYTSATCRHCARCWLCCSHGGRHGLPRMELTIWEEDSYKHIVPWELGAIATSLGCCGSIAAGSLLVWGDSKGLAESVTYSEAEGKVGKSM